MSPLLPNSLLSLDDESMIRLVTTQAPKTAANHSKIRSGSDLASKINIANVDPVTGMATGENTAYALGGYIRFKAEGDMALTDLAQKNDGIMYAAGSE